MVKVEVRSCHLNWSVVNTDQDLRTSLMFFASDRSCEKS